MGRLVLFMAAQYKAQYKACISDNLYGNAIRIPATVVFSHFLLE